MSKKDEAWQYLERTLQEFGLTDPKRAEERPPGACGRQEAANYAHWLKAIQEDLPKVMEANLTVEQIYILGRLLFVVLAQAAKADPNKPHVKMVAEAAKNLMGIGHLPEHISEALNSGDGTYRP